MNPTEHPGWSVRITYTGPGDVDSVALGADFLDRLEADAVTTGPGIITITFTVDQPDYPRAHQRAIDLAARQLGDVGPWEIAGVDILHHDLLDTELAQPLYPPLVGITEAGEILGVTRQRAHAIAKTDDFPQPIATLASGPVFSEHAVRAFAARPRRSGRPPKHELDLSVAAAAIEVAIRMADEHTLVRGSKRR